MGAIVFGLQPNGGHAFIDQSSILACIQTIGMVDATGKSIVADRSSATLKPCQQPCPGICRDLELNRAAGILLNDHCSGSNFRSCDKGSNLHFHKIAAAQLAVDCEFKQRAISHASYPIKEKRTAQIWRCFSGFLTPTFRPAFQAGRPSAVGSYCAIPISVLLSPTLAVKRTYEKSG